MKKEFTIVRLPFSSIEADFATEEEYKINQNLIKTLLSRTNNLELIDTQKNDNNVYKTYRKENITYTFLFRNDSCDFIKILVEDRK